MRAGDCARKAGSSRTFVVTVSDRSLLDRLTD
jgi:hypothetical protein